MPRLNIQKWGNSAAVRLPVGVLSQLGAKIGDSLEIDVSGNAAILRIAKPHYTLDALLARCNPDAPAPDMAWWDEAKPVGQEVW